MSFTHQQSAHLPVEVNPYAPPQGRSFFDLPRLPMERFAEVNIRVVDVHCRLLMRRLNCEGTEDSELTYDGWGTWSIGECVYANRILRARNLGFGWGFQYWNLVAPRLDFEIEWRGFRVPARFEQAVKFTLRGIQFRSFRLWIAEQLVYDET